MRNFGTVFVYPHFYFVVALSLFVLPVPLVFGWVVASLVHEACHLLMALILKVKVLSIKIGATGAAIKTEPMSPVQELCCSLAGPVGGLIPLLFVRYIPYIALSAAVQSCYNFLPVYPLDGGRAVKSAATCIVGESSAHKISVIFSTTVVIFAAAAGMWMSFRYRLGIWPIVFPVVPLLCNVWKNSLQRKQKNCRI